MKKILATGALLLLLVSSIKSQEVNVGHFVTTNDMFNPTINSFKENGDLHMRRRWEWSDLQKESVKFLGLNLYVPVENRNFGFTVCLNETDTGLGVKYAVQATANQNLKVSDKIRLSFGFGIGRESNTYHKSKISCFNQLDATAFNMINKSTTFSLGAMIQVSNYFFGSSANFCLNKNGVKEITGTDYRLGRFIELGENYFLRFMYVGRRYRYPALNEEKHIINSRFYKVNQELSLYCLLYNKVWLGTSVQINQQIGVVVRRKFSEYFTIGYQYDIKKGNGFNRKNAHELSFSYCY
ncbi:type IX secretion system membrane protein PorP/SprF [Labilibaculum euxinus]